MWFSIYCFDSSDNDCIWERGNRTWRKNLVARAEDGVILHVVAIIGSDFSLCLRNTEIVDI